MSSEPCATPVPVRHRYFLSLAYDGTDFIGWQIQPEGRTVQGVLEERLSTLLRRPVAIVGAGRTDTGVHAARMVCHLDLEEPGEEPEALLCRLRRFLPPDMAALDIHRVADDAHARYSALSRLYRYCVRTSPSPFTRKYCTVVPERTDFVAMNRAARALLGEQDFTAFSKKHSQVSTYLCRVTEAEWSEEGEGRFVFRIRANRFLRNMVRAIVGTLFEVGAGKITAEEFGEILRSRDRSRAGTTAPAEGLFLEEVAYPVDLFL